MAPCRIGALLVRCTGLDHNSHYVGHGVHMVHNFARGAGQAIPVEGVGPLTCTRCDPCEGSACGRRIRLWGGGGTHVPRGQDRSIEGLSRLWSGSFPFRNNMSKCSSETSRVAEIVGIVG